MTASGPVLKIFMEYVPNISDESPTLHHFVSNLTKRKNSNNSSNNNNNSNSSPNSLPKSLHKGTSYYHTSSKKNKINCFELVNLALKIAKGLRFLHDRSGVAHLALKPENVLVSSKWKWRGSNQLRRGISIKLIDFEEAVEFDKKANDEDIKISAQPSVQSNQVFGVYPKRLLGKTYNPKTADGTIDHHIMFDKEINIFI